MEEVEEQFSLNASVHLKARDFKLLKDFQIYLRDFRLLSNKILQVNCLQAGPKNWQQIQGHLSVVPCQILWLQ